MNNLNGEGFKTDNFKSKVSLMRSSSTNFYPDYQMPTSNLPPYFPKRGKTSQHSRSRKKGLKRVWVSKKESYQNIKKSGYNCVINQSKQSTISIEGTKKIVNPKSYQGYEKPKRINTAHSHGRGQKIHFNSKQKNVLMNKFQTKITNPMFVLH
mmetsp:Transcript_923/g.801  ORF Transcript_923/g.801 Transcript_923/m.801 type:complete len:153 (+) Transcript_923:2-460(+)